MMDLASQQLLSIASYRTETLDAVFLFFTFLGHEPFLLFFVAIGYWFVDKRIFARATLMLIVAGLINAFIKGAVQEVRPNIHPEFAADGWSFPSGHAQMAAALWLYLAYVWRRQRVLATSLVGVAVLVAASRPYLGVHYVHDVVAGGVLGALQLGLFLLWLRVEPSATSRSWSRAWIPLVAVLLYGAVRTVFDPTVQAGSIRLVGALVGLMIGIDLERRWIQAALPRSIGRGAWVLLVGTIGILVVWMGLGMLLRRLQLDGNLELQCFRYGLLGLWIGAGVPAVSSPKSIVINREGEGDLDEKQNRNAGEEVTARPKDRHRGHAEGEQDSSHEALRRMVGDGVDECGTSDGVGPAR